METYEELRIKKGSEQFYSFPHRILLLPFG